MSRLQTIQKAKLNQAFKSNIVLREYLESLRIEFDGETMQQARDEAESLLQSLHEFSAYQNAIEATKSKKDN